MAEKMANGKAIGNNVHITEYPEFMLRNIPRNWGKAASAYVDNKGYFQYCD
jgi:hypothetical protein